MVAIGGKISSRLFLLKNIQQCRVGNLFLHTFSAVGRSVQVINRSFRRRSTEESYHSTGHSLQNFKSRQVFVDNPIAGVMNNYNTINYKMTKCCLTEGLHSQACLMDISAAAVVPTIGPDDDARELMRTRLVNIEELVEFLREENASDVCVIRVPPHLDYVDYFVVCSGFGSRHLRRMAGALVTEVRMYISMFCLGVWHNYSRLMSVVIS